MVKEHASEDVKRSKWLADLNFEREAEAKGFEFVVGIDEAGRGPLAGPVVAAAVLLHKKNFQSKIADSKKLSPSQREKAYHEIHQNSYFGIGIISECIVDINNIARATYHAMEVAVFNLIARLPIPQISQEDFPKKVFLLVDGKFFKTELPYSHQTIISGDSLSLSIACASIVAKVTRDRILMMYDKVFPEYGFKQHKGYGTLAHRKAIQQFGLSPIHRKTYYSQ